MVWLFSMFDACGLKSFDVWESVEVFVVGDYLGDAEAFHGLVGR